MDQQPNSLNPALHNSHLPGDAFFWPGGPVGVLLSHGYTATTAEVRLLAGHLHRQGYTVSGPLLPGHGLDPQALNRCRWQDWVKALSDAYHHLTARCERVFVGGESMGALLALYLAGEQPEIAGILAYAPALAVPRMTTLKARLAAPFVRTSPKRTLHYDADGKWQGYKVNSIPAFLQLTHLQRQVRRRLAHLRQPLLIVQGRLDTAIDLRGVGILYREIGSPLKELHWLEHTGHLVMLDHEIEQVTSLTLRFMERCLGT
ncbi:MAG: alpha/beta fold hydrolase [Anaerolineales bacterium]|nr:alpha/beta fold hydrolase [Anaerolineales bacterium]